MAACISLQWDRDSQYRCWVYSQFLQAASNSLWKVYVSTQRGWNIYLTSKCNWKVFSVFMLPSKQHLFTISYWIISWWTFFTGTAYLLHTLLVRILFYGNIVNSMSSFDSRKRVLLLTLYMLPFFYFNFCLFQNCKK